MTKKFTITVATKNRLPELKVTLEKLAPLLNDATVHCLICDDGSDDGTFEYITTFHPGIEIFRNTVSKGIHYARNRMFEKVKTPYVISIDDDIHLISENPLQIIEDYFIRNPHCAIAAFRIFWSLDDPKSLDTNQQAEIVKSFGAGASAWNMKAWHAIPPYPEWFVFYGEEDFAAYQLFKKGLEIHFVPEILSHHRVNIKERKKHDDYRLRTRRALRSGWYLMFLFYPWNMIPRHLSYSIWIQFRTKTMKGDLKATVGMIQALFDVVINFPKLTRQSNRLTSEEFSAYRQLPPAKLYWKPEDEQLSGSEQNNSSNEN